MGRTPTAATVARKVAAASAVVAEGVGRKNWQIDCRGLQVSHFAAATAARFGR